MNEGPESVPCLIVRLPDGERRIRLGGSNRWTIGRSKTNDIVLPDTKVSRKHALLDETRPGTFSVIDLGTHNGTLVNDRRVVVPLVLRNGDRICFGNCEAVYHTPSESMDDTGVTMVTEIGSAHCLVSVMVVDVRDFTGMTQKVGDERLSEIIGTWFRKGGLILESRGAYEEKYIGDAVMAVWLHDGKRCPREDAQRVFGAVREFSRITTQVRDLFELDFPIRIGAGINTGYAVVGNTGPNGRPDFSPLGDTVNMAFRLESATKDLGADIVIGPATYQRLCDSGLDVASFKRTSARLKGYKDTITAYSADFGDLDRFLENLGPA